MNDTPSCQRGAVLITGMMMLAMLSILLTSVFRTSAISLAHAASLRIANRTFSACDEALRAGMQAPVFVRAHDTVSNQSRPYGITLTTTLRYIGRSDDIDHPDFDAVRHAALDAHYFELTAEAQGPRSNIERQQQLFFVIAAATTPANVALARNSGIDVSAFGDSVIPVAWRRLTQ